jgi:hypothetical protein
MWSIRPGYQRDMQLDDSPATSAHDGGMPEDERWERLLDWEGLVALEGSPERAAQAAVHDIPGLPRRIRAAS